MRIARIVAAGTLLCVAACGGGGSDTSPPPPVSYYAIGGTVAGLQGSGLVLLNNAGDNLSVLANSTTFTFSTKVASGDPFSVSVMTQPANPSQTCAVAHASGTVTGNDITNVAVTCTTNNYTIAGTVSGLTGTGLSLTDKAGGTVSIAAGGPFTFTLPNTLQSGTAYAVTVAQDPISPPQGCSVANGSGTVQGNTVSVQVTCHKASEELLVADPQGNVVIYLIDPATGTLAPTSTPPIASVSTPTTDAAGTFVYATSNAGVSAYTVDSMTAALVPVAGSPFATSSPPQDLVIDLTGQFLYSGSSVGAFAFTRNAVTGTLFPVLGSPFTSPTSGLNGTPLSPGAVGGFFGASSSFIYYPIDFEGCNCFGLAGFAINSSTGALTSLSSVGPGIPQPHPYGAVNPTGTILFLNGDAYSIDAKTGAVTLSSTAPIQIGITGFALNPAGTFAYVMDGASVYAYSVNGTTGALTSVAGNPFSTANSVDLNIAGSRLVAFDQTHAYLYVANRFANDNISAFSVNSSTGALTPIAGSPAGVPTTINGPYTLATAKIP